MFYIQSMHKRSQKHVSIICYQQLSTIMSKSSGALFTKYIQNIIFLLNGRLLKEKFTLEAALTSYFFTTY